MSETAVLSSALKKQIDAWCEKYPPDRRQSAIMGALMAAQEENGGYLTEPIIAACANYLGMAPILYLPTGACSYIE